MKWNDENVKLVEKFIEIRNRGFYCDGAQLTNVYNEVLEKNVQVTNCGSCMRARISELETALNSFKKTLEVNEEPKAKETAVKEEENKESDEPKKAVRNKKKK